VQITLTIVAGVPGAGKSSFLGAAQYSSDPQRIVIETDLTEELPFTAAETAKKAGLSVELVYIALNDLEENLSRVQNRMQRGGAHSTQEEVQKAFSGRWDNLIKILPHCTKATLWDNTNGFTCVAEYKDDAPHLNGEAKPAWLEELQHHMNMRE